MITAADTKIPSTPQYRFRKTVWQIAPGDLAWVWDAKLRLLTSVYRAVKRHSFSDGDGKVLHPFEPKPTPAVTWDAELVARLNPTLNQAEIYSLYNQHDRGACGLQLFIKSNMRFHRRLYCYGPLSTSMAEALQKAGKLEALGFVSVDEGAPPQPHF